MANIKITDLSGYTDPESTDVLPIVDVTNDETKKVSIADLMENAGSGTEALPGIAFDNDPNTGIYRAGADQLAISTAGTQRLLISDTGAVTIPGDLTVQGTTTTIDTTNLIVEDKNIEMGSVATPTDTTADGGGITLKGATDKTINWVNATDAWTSSERFDFPAGTEGAPSIILNGDVDSGIYQPGANQVAISTGGQGRLFVDNNGRVGVNKSSLSRTFEIEDANARASLASTTGTNGVLWLITNTAGSLVVGRDDSTGAIYGQGAYASHLRSGGAYPLVLSTDNTPALTIDSSQRVGLGTGSPEGAFQINGTGGTSNTTAQLRFSLGGTTEGIFGVATAANNVISGSAQGDSVIRNDGGNINFSVDSGTSMHMRLDSSGRLGIGTTSPGKRLEIATASNQDGILIKNTGNVFGALDFDSNRSIAGTVLGETRFLWNGTAVARIQGESGSDTTNKDDGHLTFYTASAGTPTEKVRIDSDGRLLVGTNTTRNVGGGASAIIQAETTSGNAISFVAHRGTNTSGSIFVLAKSRGTEPGSSDIVANDDELGAIRFAGADGTDVESRAASVAAFVDGSPGASEMPGRLIFSTNAGTTGAAPTERMRISANGNLTVDTDTFFVDAVNNRVGIGTTSPTTALEVQSASNTTIRIDNEDDSTATLVFHNTGSTDRQISVVDGEMRFGGSSDEQMRIDSSGRLLVGTTSARSIGAVGNHAVEIEGTGFAGSSLSIFNNENASQPAYFTLGKSRGTSIGSNTIVQSGDVIGSIDFAAADGTDASTNAARIRALVDGTPGENDMPGALVFSTTADGESSPTTRMTIKNDGRVGIGSTAPGDYGANLAVANTSGNSIISVAASTSGISGINFADGTGSAAARAAGFIQHQHSNNSLNFGIADDTKVTLDSSGRLLVGTSTSLFGNTNIQSGNTGGNNFTGIRYSTGAGGAQLVLGHSQSGTVGSNVLLSNDDYIGAVEFRGADGANYLVGASIDARVDGTPGTNDMPTRLVFSTTKDGESSPTEAVRITSTQATIFTNDIRPSTDNNADVGSASLRWRTIYAGTGTINTSDANLKQDIESLEAAEISAATAIRGLIKKFRFVDAVADKGDDARIHVGVIAQEVEQAFIDAGLDPRRYGLFCEDELEDGTKRLGIRYDELLAFVIAAF